jgi:hypothetical protein
MGGTTVLSELDVNLLDIFYCKCTVKRIFTCLNVNLLLDGFQNIEGTYSKYRRNLFQI